MPSTSDSVASLTSIDSVGEQYVGKVSSGGSLDSTFANGGWVTLDIAGKNDQGGHIISNRDGDITVIGSTTQLDDLGGQDFAIAHYQSDGSLDQSFGNDGVVVERNTNEFSFRYIVDTIEDPNGGFFLISYETGHQSASTPRSALTRYDSQGQRDTSFGANGQIPLLFDATARLDASTIALDSTGNLLLAGSVRYPGETSSNLGIVRYTNEGLLDKSFGDSGKILTALNGHYEIGDRILLTETGFYVTGAGELEQDGFHAARYFNDGRLDTNFGDGGQVLLEQHVQKSHVDQNGRLLAAYTTQRDNDSDLVLTRFDLSGDLDSSFGNVGLVTTPIPGLHSYVTGGITVDSHGSITAAGTITHAYPHSNSDIFLARYSHNGQLDSRFGVEGLTITDFNGKPDSVQDITLDQNGNLLLSGSTQTSTGQDFVVARYTTSGFIRDESAASTNALLWNQTSGDVSLADFSDSLQASQTSLQRDLTDQDWQIKTLGDLNGNGQEDALLRHASGQVLAWYLDSDRSEVTAEKLIGRLLPEEWDIVGVGDLNGDDQTDLLLRHGTADQTLAWFMDNQGNILSETLVGRSFEDSRWSIEATADFTGDGQADLLLRHYDSGQNLLMEMDGTEIVSERLIGRVVEDLDWQIVGAKDLNGDGEMDIIWQNSVASQTLLWQMQNGQIAQERLIQGIADSNTQLVF